MNQMKKSAMSWRTIIMLLLVPVLFYSCTVSRPVIETGTEQRVEPGVETGTEPEVVHSVEPGTEPEVVHSVEPGAEPDVGHGAESGTKPGVEFGAETGTEAGVETGAETGVEPGDEPGAETGIKPSEQPVTGLRVIGEVEPVTLIKAGLTMPARIDTGATTSSMDATDIKNFERDGKKWVRFMVTDRRNGEQKKMECRLSRNVKIKRHGKESLSRPVVTVRAMIGGVELVREFSLTDRSEFKYPILIGRNFLEGEFIVDVNRKNVTTPMSEN